MTSSHLVVVYYDNREGEMCAQAELKEGIKDDDFIKSLEFHERDEIGFRRKNYGRDRLIGEDGSYYRDVRAPKLIRFGRAGPKLVRFGKRSDPSMNEEYDNVMNEMISEYKRGGPKLVRFG
ncbi:flp-5 [Pristionchus pacificus]|uniref:Uncharacterized protein n=1 Tax=Pristionchus pacificus TaxID=54126 RepID=A0A2A6BES5_PRIPA|nr:flp-5 [Pristionchus pacificus]|eukprot:PDM64311.1 hypothetical protein PRIPAC_52567 [Pristionchus pacificus]